MSDIPTTMAAMVLTGHGGLDKLVYRDDVPVPRPAAGDELFVVCRENERRWGEDNKF